MRTGHRGHTCQFNAILDDVVDFTVTEILRGIGVQIRDARIDVRADGGSSPSIDTMTGSAASEEVFAALLDCCPIVNIGILPAALL